MSQGRCIITGGTGAVGPAVALTFREAGYDVTVASRRAPTEGLVPEGVRYARVDVTDPDSFGGIFEGADVVVHLASLLHINSPGEALRAEYERVNVGGTKRVVEAARTGGVRRVVLSSSIAVYGYDRGETVDESSEPHPKTLYGQTKLEAEAMAHQSVSAGGEPLVTVLRLPAVYGAGMRGNYMTLLHALSRRRFIPIGPGENMRTLIHASDASRAILLAAESTHGAGGTYNVTDGAFHSLHEILQAMCTALGRSYPAVSVPVGLARATATPADMLLKVAGSSKRVSTLLDKYLEDVRVSGRRFAEEFGFQPHFDLDSGWADTVARLRERGELPARC